MLNKDLKPIHLIDTLGVENLHKTMGLDYPSSDFMDKLDFTINDDWLTLADTLIKDIDVRTMIEDTYSYGGTLEELDEEYLVHPITTTYQEFKSIGKGKLTTHMLIRFLENDFIIKYIESLGATMIEGSHLTHCLEMSGFHNEADVFVLNFYKEVLNG